MKKVTKAMYGKIMMKGGSSKMKKYAKGGEGELGPVYTQASGGKGGAGTYDPTKTTTTKTTKTYKTGGIIKAKKGIIMGPGDGDKKKKKSSTTPEFNTPIEKPEVDTAKKTYKNPLVARIGSYFTGKEYQKGTNPVTGMDVTRTYEDGKKTRVLKVKNQEEKKMGGAKMKKYANGGKTSAYSNAATNPVDEKVAMNALGIKQPKPKKSIFPNAEQNSGQTRTGKYGGTTKTKMKTGGAKPKAMYGTSMKSGMMKMGGAKKK